MEEFVDALSGSPRQLPILPWLPTAAEARKEREEGFLAPGYPLHCRRVESALESVGSMTRESRDNQKDDTKSC